MIRRYLNVVRGEENDAENVEIEGSLLLSLEQMARLVNSGWKFELYSWETVCHGYLRKFAEDNGKFIRLEDYYQNITFIKGGRQAVPLKPL